MKRIDDFSECIQTLLFNFEWVVARAFDEGFEFSFDFIRLSKVIEGYFNRRRKSCYAYLETSFLFQSATCVSDAVAMKTENVLNLICCYSIAQKKLHLFSVRFHKGNNYAIYSQTTRKKNTVKITTLNAFDVGQLKTKAQQKENKSWLEQKGARARPRKDRKKRSENKSYASEWRR